MRVLFLDFDGVLNTSGYRRAHRDDPEPLLDPACMTRLRDIIDATGAQIVLTTSWRWHWSPDASKCNEIGREITRRFAAYGLTIADKTSDDERHREENIRAWLTAHPDTACFAVLDDAFLEADFLQGHFVRTSSLRDGLDADAAQAVIALLMS